MKCFLSWDKWGRSLNVTFSDNATLAGRHLALIIFNAAVTPGGEIEDHIGDQQGN